MLGEELPQLGYHFGIDIGMTPTFGLTQTFAITHLRPQTIKSFRFVKVEIMMANPSFYACVCC